MAVSPPGPFMQRTNALVHKEPIATLFSGIVSFLLLVLMPPIAIFYLQLQMLWDLVKWLVRMDGSGFYDPKMHSTTTELAVIITGCDSGFGKELAFWAADAGFVVFAGCLSKESFARFDGQSNITPLRMDVTKDEDVNKAVDQVSAWLEDPTASKNRLLHGLCNNAGIGFGGNLDWLALSDFEKVMDVNYIGIIRCIKAFLPILKTQAIQGKHKGARIINMASMAGKSPPFPGFICYAASKHAAVVLGTGLRPELAPFNIQVSTVCPSFHGTPMVTEMRGEIMAMWNAIPEAKQKEYGEDYLKTADAAADFAIQSMWKPEVVVRQMLRGLTIETVPKEMIIGLDAKVTSLLPGRVLEVMGISIMGKQVPAAMKQN